MPQLALPQLFRKPLYLRYGKGQEHRAGLNYGDVMAYVLDLLRKWEAGGCPVPAFAEWSEYE